jgi:thymidylate synthase ThyX
MKLPQQFSESLCKLFTDNQTGEMFVAIGDGQTLPYRQFISQKVFELAQGYLLSPTSSVTALNPKKLAGLMGALLARQSRAPGTVIDVLVNEFLVTTEEEAVELGVKIGDLREGKLEQLIERILIQYGDDSVQELEYATVLFNSVSNLATKEIEDRRLGGYIEQSSRYVYYNQKDQVNGDWLYYRPQAILNSPLRQEYISVMDECFEIYDRLTVALEDFYKKQKPITETEYAIIPNDTKKYRLSDLTDKSQIKLFERTYGFDIRTKACDTARILLPAATMTNVAMVANGRTFEHLLKRMYTSDREEFVSIANRLHDTLNKTIPKYVKRANRNGESFWKQNISDIKKDIAEFIPNALIPKNQLESVKVHEIPRLLSADTEAVVHSLAAVYFPYVCCSYDELVQLLSVKREDELFVLMARAVGNRQSRRDRVVRGFEHGYDITTEIVCDFGAFRDLHRHRMCTLQWQRLNPHHGFDIHNDIEAVGFGDAIRAVEEKVRNLYDGLKSMLGAELAEYVVLFGHNMRFMIGMNLREAQHLLELRTVQQGHPNYRRVCQAIHSQIIELAPWLKKTDLFKFVDHNNYDWARADAEARQSQKMLEKGINSELINE